MDSNSAKGSLSDHLANERTFLAWIRTSVGIMAFGFVLVKFTFFLKQIEIVLADKSRIPNPGYSSMAGIGLVALGSAIALLAYFRYRQIGRQLAESNYRHSLRLSVWLTTFIVLTGIFMVVYLLRNG